MEAGVSTVFGHLRRLVMDESAETRGVARPKALGRAAHTGDSRLRNLTLVSEAGSAESRHTLTPRHGGRVHSATSGLPRFLVNPSAQQFFQFEAVWVFLAEFFSSSHSQDVGIALFYDF